MNGLRNTIVGLTLTIVLLGAAPAMARTRADGRIGVPVAAQGTPPGYPYPPPAYVSPPPRFLDPPPPAYVYPPGTPAYPPGTPVYPQPGYVYPAPGYGYPAPGYGYPRPVHPSYPHRPAPPNWREYDRDRDGVPDRWDRRPDDPWRR